MRKDKDEKERKSVVNDSENEYYELVEIIRSSDSPAFKEYLEEITAYQFQPEKSDD